MGTAPTAGGACAGRNVTSRNCKPPSYIRMLA